MHSIQWMDEIWWKSTFLLHSVWFPNITDIIAFCHTDILCDTLAPSVVLQYKLMSRWSIWKEIGAALPLYSSVKISVWHFVLFTCHNDIRYEHTWNCTAKGLIDWVRLNVPPTQYRSYGDGFLRVKWPKQQCQSTEGTLNQIKQNTTMHLN